MAAPIMRHFPIPCIAAITTLMLISTPMKPCLAATDADPSLSPYVEFVRKSCAYTTFPQVCYETLSSFASKIQTSPTELANTALYVSLNGVLSTSDVVTNLSRRSDLSQRESGAVVDCMDVIRDSVDELRQSLVAMRYQRYVEGIIRSNMVTVAKLTSNALALVNRLSK